MDNTSIAVAFPPHNVKPAKKGEKEWGLQGAKATWHHNTASAPSLFYNDRESYNTFVKYAFGEQDVSQYKPPLHINAKNQENSFLGGIRWQIKNFATKRVNSTVSKIVNRKYDAVATAIDPASADRREDFKASVKTWIDHQDWLQERQSMIGIDMLPEGMDPSTLPLNDEDLNLYMQNDYKLNNEIATEIGIQYHLDRLNFEDIKEKAAYYLTILPVTGVWCGMDANNLPVVKSLNPARILCPRSEFNDFKRLAYSGYVDDYTVAEFKKLAGGEFSEDELKRLADSFAKKGDYHAFQYSAEYPTTSRDVDTMMILHFEIATTDEYVYLERKDKHGNDRFVEKPYDYYRTEDQQKNFQKKYRGERKIYRVQKPTTYGGYWIVGSDVVFGYGEKNYCKGELGYKLRASNMLSGRSSSMVKQMIPSLDLLETYDKKIQQLVASAIPRIIKIDLFALRKASFKMNNKDMTTQDLLEMFFQTGVIVTDTSDMGATGDTRKPIETFQAGMSDDIVKYLELMRHELEILDEITGYNRVSTGATLSPETGARVAQMMDNSTDTNLDHLFRADRGLCRDIYEALGHLHANSVKLNPEYYIPIIGEEAVTRILASIPFDEMGIDVEARPTQQEWNQFYTEIQQMAADKELESEDLSALRRFRSLKQAHSYLRVITRRRKAEKQQQEMSLVQANAQAQQQSNAQTSENNMNLELMKRQTEIILRQIDDQRKDKDHVQKMEQLQLQVGLINQGKLADTALEGEYSIREAKARPRAQS